MNPSRRISIIAASAMAVLLPAVLAHAQEGGLNPTEKATAYFQAGQYEPAIQLLRPAIGNVELTGEDRWSAYELLAASYIMNGQEDEGRRAFIQLLNENAEYAGPPSPPYSDLVVSQFSRAKEEWVALRRQTQLSGGGGGEDGKPIYKKTWFLILGGAVVVGAAVLIAGG